MNIALVGHGKMGQMVESIVEADKDLEMAGIKDKGYYLTLKDFPRDFDVIIDYSHPDYLAEILEYGVRKKKPLVIATTGHTDEQKKWISEASKTTPIVYSANFSLGVNIMEKVLKEITPILKDSFDMEIIEKHHNQKLDAPSGTAKVLAKAMNPDGEFEETFGREGMARRRKEIGIHAVRGGNIPGEHIAIYAGEDEILEIKHIANSRKIFALGSLKAAKFVVDQKPGLYNMTHVLFGED